MENRDVIRVCHPVCFLVPKLVDTISLPPGDSGPLQSRPPQPIVRSGEELAARNEIFEAVEAEVVTFLHMIGTRRLAFIEHRDLYLRTIYARSFRKRSSL